MTLSYKEALTAAMSMLCADPLFRWVGYGLLDGKGANGTAKMVPNEKTIECIVSENLMLGMAQGLSMAGLKPTVLFERANFLMVAMDSLVNHLDCCDLISRGEFKPCVIIRVVVGGSQKPLFTGHTHVGDFSEALKLMLKMPVLVCRDAYEVTEFYRIAKQRQDDGVGSTLLVEYKDLLQ